MDMHVTQNYVCCLWKLLYGGLKQAPRAQVDKIFNSILQACAHFYQSPNDSSTFIWWAAHGCTILLLYVNDMIISKNDTTE